jgi:hypothetical protein
MRNSYRILVGSLKVRDQWADLSVDGRITLKLILKEYNIIMWSGFI